MIRSLCYTYHKQWSHNIHRKVKVIRHWWNGVYCWILKSWSWNEPKNCNCYRLKKGKYCCWWWNFQRRIFIWIHEIRIQSISLIIVVGDGGRSVIDTTWRVCKRHIVYDGISFLIEERKGRFVIENQLNVSGKDYS